MPRNAPWVDLHHHSEFSLLDGYGSVENHVKRAKELGHPAVTFTEHGTARGFYTVDKVCKAEGVKAIFGIEFYVSRNCRIHDLTAEQIASVTAGLKGKEATAAKKDFERALGISEARHCVAIALNDEGVKNLIRLNNLANTVGLRVSRGQPKARIDIDLLCQYNEGLAVSTACLGGIAAIPWREDDDDRLYNDLEQLFETFGPERLSLEIQPHDIGEQRAWNLEAVRLHRELGIPLMATNDSHYVTREDWETHDALITMRFGRLLADPDRIRYEAQSFALKTQRQLEDAFDENHPDIPFKIIDEAIERAAMLAELSNGKLWSPKTILLPEITKEDPDEELRDMCLSGWGFREIGRRRKRLGLSRNAYLDRLSHELGVIEGLGFAKYFLIVYDLIKWARSKGIVTGPGRGSAAGSLVCFLLGITSLDPIEFDLLFERFLTPGRPDWPDIDIDIERDRRHEVLTYLHGKYGHVAQIGTITRMRGRSAFKDVARVHGTNHNVVEEISRAIVGSVVRDDDDGSVAEALKTSKDLQAFQAQNPSLIRQVLDLEGHVRHAGIHPAGVVCSPIPFDDFVPLETRVSKGQRVTVTAYDMHDVEAIGLIKVDVLGLKLLSVIGVCKQFVKERRGIELDLEALTLDDPDVFDMFTAQDFAGTFQYDTPSAYKMTRGIKFTGFDDVIGTNAVNRPGPAQSGLADEWKVRQGDPRKRVAFHKVVDEICSDSYGVIIYQEHIIRILQAFGFTPAEAGKLRKIIGKSKGIDALEQYRDQFVDGAFNAGMRETDAERLWSQITKFGKYGFNKSHAAAYGQIAYWCMYLKMRFPLEFFGALLSCERKAEKANRIVREAARRGVTIEPPNLNRSETSWVIGSGSLVAGLSSIKGVGENACKELLSRRPFTDMGDLFARVNRRVVTKGVISALIRAGALRELWPNTRHALENLEELMKRLKRKNGLDLASELIAEGDDAPRFDKEEEWALQLTVGVAGPGHHPLGVIDSMKNVFRSDWGDMSEVVDGDMIRGVVSNHRVGTSGGRRWASLELEDENGNNVRIKFDDDGYSDWKDIIGLGDGAVLAARVRSRRGSCYPEYLVDLLALRRKYNEGVDPLDWGVWERSTLTSKRHALADYENPWSGLSWKSGRACLVTHVKVIRDSSLRKMAFVRLEGLSGPSRECVVFADNWGAMRIFPGDVMRVSGSVDASRGSLILRGAKPAKRLA